MSSPSTDTPRGRRAFDQVDRQARRRWLWGAGGGVVAVFALATLVWWSGEEAAPRDGAPNWSPDGRAIVFAAEVGDRHGDIFIMNLDGRGRRPLTTSAANDTSPAMSPDGTRIAFESDRDGNPEIYVMDQNGRNVRRLTSNPARDLAPAWSPDSSRIVFTSDRDSRAAADVYVMKADGTALERLTSDRANWAPQFSPDGRRLAVQIDRDVWVIDTVTRERQRLTFEPLDGMNPTWSPDGSRIAFVTQRNRKAEIFTMKADGRDARVLVSMANRSVIDPRWSPTGTHIAFVMIPDGTTPDMSQNPQAIYTIELASERVVRVSR